MFKRRDLAPFEDGSSFSLASTVESVFPGFCSAAEAEATEDLSPEWVSVSDN